MAKDQDDDSFVKLWLLWRKHARKSDGRGKARPTYFKWLSEGADPADIYDGATYHLRTMTDKDRPYITLLSVYLNSEKWMDECEQERDYQRRMAERTQQPKPAPSRAVEPVVAQMTQEEREAAQRRIAEQYGVRLEGLH